jgi:hypothetical protein
MNRFLALAATLVVIGINAAANIIPINGFNTASAGLAAGGALGWFSRFRSWNRPVSYSPAHRATNATARKQLFSINL